MNWISNFIRPKIQSLLKSDVGQELWEKCPSCEQMIFAKELEKRHKVCPHCNLHFRLPARTRLSLLFDGGKYRLHAPVEVRPDPLKFRDKKRYNERLKEARHKSRNAEALLVAQGTIGGWTVIAAALDFGFMGGSMGVAVGEGIVRAARSAIDERCPFLAITSSGGARIQEGALSLMQMPRTIAAVQMVKSAKLPYIALLCDPTTGGVSASFAMLGDILISEPGALIGFAGQRVIRETIGESLPPGFQTAEYLYRHGMLDMVVERKDLPKTLAKILGFLHPDAKRKNIEKKSAQHPAT